MIYKAKTLIKTVLRPKIEERTETPIITEIHIEHIDETWRQLVEWVKKHPQTMLMPAFSPKFPNPTVLLLYKKLIDTSRNPIGLHVHLCDDLDSPPLPLPNYEKQHETLKKGLDQLMNFGVKTIDFTSGHWSYNRDTFRVCARLGLENIHIKLGEIPEITFQQGFPKGLKLIPVVRHIHDYEL